MMLQDKMHPQTDETVRWMQSMPALWLDKTLFGERNVEQCGAIRSNKATMWVLCLGVMAPFTGCVEHESKRGHAALKSLY